MSTETLIIEGQLIFVTYETEQEERPSLYSPGHSGGYTRLEITLPSGEDALPYVMSIDGDTKEDARAWVERLLDRKLDKWAEDMQGERAAERMRYGRRSC